MPLYLWHVVTGRAHCSILLYIYIYIERERHWQWLVFLLLYSTELFREGTAALTLWEYTKMILRCNVFLSPANYNKFEFTRIGNNGYSV